MTDTHFTAVARWSGYDWSVTNEQTGAQAEANLAISELLPCP